ncbi:probable amino acid permease 7 isoform X1 [Tanacetum coccineum]
MQEEEEVSEVELAQKPTKMSGVDYDDDDEEKHPPLLLQTSLHTPTGTVWTALSHFIAGVIGSGVLSLAWSMAQLGWIAGPLCIVLVAFFALVSAHLITNFHVYTNPDDGTSTTNHSYLQAVRNILGEIFASQIPNIFHTKWLSIIAAIMSFTYSLIGIGLGLGQVIEQGKIEGSVNGITTTNSIQKVWLVAQAIGDITFAMNFSLILLEIQSTLKTPPSQKTTMKKTSTIAVVITASFYLLCGGSGYAAFGDSTPGNLLTGFGFYEPYWLVDFGNACIVLHLVGGYQIYSQTLYAIAERWYAEKFPESLLLTDIQNLKVSLLPEFRVNSLRLCFRTTYVIFTMSVAMLFPYFNEVLAFAGSITFWPLTIYFPVEMYFVFKKIKRWSGKWILLRIYSTFSLIVSVFNLVGSLEGLIAKRFG